MIFFILFQLVVMGRTAERLSGFRHAFHHQEWKKIWLWAIAKYILKRGLINVPDWQYFDEERETFDTKIRTAVSLSVGDIKWQDVHEIWNRRMVEKHCLLTSFDYQQLQWSISMLSDIETLQLLLLMGKDQYGVPTYKKLHYSTRDMRELFGLHSRWQRVKDVKTIIKEETRRKKRNNWRFKGKRFDAGIDYDTDSGYETDSCDWGDFSD